jgi:hypothetical protein
MILTEELGVLENLFSAEVLPSSFSLFVLDEGTIRGGRNGTFCIDMEPSLEDGLLFCSTIEGIPEFPNVDWASPFKLFGFGLLFTYTVTSCTSIPELLIPFVSDPGV